MTRLTETKNVSKSIIQKDVSLANYTTWQIGGPAQYFSEPNNLEELYSAIRFAKNRSLPLYPLGNGSNVLFPESGFSGLVVKLKGEFGTISVKGSSLSIGPGTSLSQLVEIASMHGAEIFNFLAGIPGTVGGGVTMNAGAAGYEIGSLVKSVTYVNPEGQLKKVHREDCQFDYRNSLFKSSNRIIISVEFDLSKRGNGPVREEVIKSRKKKTPIRKPTAGCVFKNPEEIGISAGELIDMMGGKGMRVGGAKVSEKHANFIINTGNATSYDVNKLIKEIKDRVYKEYGIVLVPEIDIVND